MSRPMHVPADIFNSRSREQKETYKTDASAVQPSTPLQIFDATVPWAQRVQRVVISLIEGFLYTIVLWSVPYLVHADMVILYEDVATMGTPYLQNASRRAKAVRRRRNAFIDNLCTQCKMVNYVAAVCIGTTATMLQDLIIVSSQIAETLALLALLCSLATLCFGVMTYIHLAKIKSANKSTTWIRKAYSSTHCRWWNVDIILSLPVAWLLWSSLLFTGAILTSYIWPAPVSGEQIVLLSRVACASVVGIWFAQVPLVAWTLTRLGRYQRETTWPGGSTRV